MGVEFVLSLRLPPLSGGGCAFSVSKVIPERGWDPLRRRRCVVAAQARNSGFPRNREGNSDCRYLSSLDGHQQNHQHLHHPHHQQHHPFHHHRHPQLHHPRQGSLDVAGQFGKLGSAFSIASESDSGAAEKLEHAFCTSSFFHHSKWPRPTKGEHITIEPSHAGGGAVAGLDLPLSLKMLKRKHQDFGKSTLGSGLLSEVGNSLLNAFSSVICMMKTLQSHTLHIGGHFFQQETGSLLIQVQRDMHVSFLWLFQQVFSCTPELMVLVMVLLTDFTAFSMANNIPMPPISMPTLPVSIYSTFPNNLEAPGEGPRADFNVSFEAPPVFDEGNGCYSDGGGSVGNGSRRVHRVAGGDDGGSDPYDSPLNLNKALYSVDDYRSIDIPSKGALSKEYFQEHSMSQTGLQSTDFSSLVDNLTASDFSAMIAAQAFEELTASEDLSKSEVPPPVGGNDEVDLVQALGMKEATEAHGYHLLDRGTMQSLVAPFSAQLEDDDYSCYDRTDLAYQDAIRSDCTNSMLLANYAQFLFLVRKDHDRAEELFRKAVMCDRFDCDAISRFASFLWLARCNLVGAEKAYAAAARADPANSFHAANYAHFLWNAGK